MPPVLAQIYQGLTSLSKLTKDSSEFGSAFSAFPVHYFYAWMGLHFPNATYSQKFGGDFSPYLRRFRGTLNAFKFWEGATANCRALLREPFTPNTFSWIPIGLHPRSGSHQDDGKLGVRTRLYDERQRWLCLLSS